MAQCMIRLGVVAAVVMSGAASARQAAPAEPGHVVAQLKEEAGALRTFIESRAVDQFLTAAESLAPIEARRVYVSKADGSPMTESDFLRLPDSERGNYHETTLDERYYYTTRYGTPLAYTRPLDLVVQSTPRPASNELGEMKILDFGYGGIGHLRVLASLGADTVGVDVDPMLKALYSEPTDTGEIENLVERRRGREGSVTLVEGQWPATQEVRDAVGGGFNLILSKNTLKRGYVHPEQKVDPRRMVHLGVEDEAFVQAMFDALEPGGKVMIYNLYPAQSPDPDKYMPWADGRCPFDRALLEKVGFRVIELDRDDSEAARDMGRRLGWDTGDGAMDLEANLFAMYTLLERPLRRGRGN